MDRLAQDTDVSKMDCLPLYTTTEELWWGKLSQ